MSGERERHPSSLVSGNDAAFRERPEETHDKEPHSLLKLEGNGQPRSRRRCAICDDGSRIRPQPKEETRHSLYRGGGGGVSEGGKGGWGKSRSWLPVLDRGGSGIAKWSSSRKKKKGRREMTLGEKERKPNSCIIEKKKEVSTSRKKGEHFRQRHELPREEKRSIVAPGKKSPRRLLPAYSIRQKMGKSEYNSGEEALSLLTRESSFSLIPARRMALRSTKRESGS